MYFSIIMLNNTKKVLNPPEFENWEDYSGSDQETEETDRHFNDSEDESDPVSDQKSDKPTKATAKKAATERAAADKAVAQNVNKEFWEEKSKEFWEEQSKEFWEEQSKEFWEEQSKEFWEEQSADKAAEESDDEKSDNEHVTASEKAAPKKAASHIQQEINSSIQQKIDDDSEKAADEAVEEAVEESDDEIPELIDLQHKLYEDSDNEQQRQKDEEEKKAFSKLLQEASSGNPTAMIKLANHYLYDDSDCIFSAKYWFEEALNTSERRAGLLGLSRLYKNHHYPFRSESKSQRFEGIVDEEDFSRRYDNALSALRDFVRLGLYKEQIIGLNEESNEESSEEESDDEESDEESSEEEEESDEESDDEATRCAIELSLQQEKSATPWPCSICTFESKGHARKCEMCNTPRNQSLEPRNRSSAPRCCSRDPDAPSREQMDLFKQTCPRCTFDNTSSAMICEMCGLILKKKGDELNVLSDHQISLLHSIQWEWQCPRCKLHNPKNKVICTLCREGNQTSSWHYCLDCKYSFPLTNGRCIGCKKKQPQVGMWHTARHVVDRNISFSGSVCVVCMKSTKDPKSHTKCEKEWASFLKLGAFPEEILLRFRSNIVRKK
jgi:hypothetical protein